MSSIFKKKTDDIKDPMIKKSNTSGRRIKFFPKYKIINKSKNKNYNKKQKQKNNIYGAECTYDYYCYNDNPNILYRDYI